MKRSKDNYKGYLDDFTYFMLLIAIMLFIFGIAFVLMPMLLLGQTIMVYILLLIIGLVLGLFITRFITDLQNITKHHHAGLWFVVLLFALISFTIVFNESIRTFHIGELSPSTSAGFASIIFAIGFFVPYIFTILDKKEIKK